MWQKLGTDSENIWMKTIVASEGAQVCIMAAAIYRYNEELKRPQNNEFKVNHNRHNLCYYIYYFTICTMIVHDD